MYLAKTRVIMSMGGDRSSPVGKIATCGDAGGKGDADAADEVEGGLCLVSIRFPEFEQRWNGESHQMWLKSCETD